MDTIAERLTAARKKAGLTQADLARKAGVSQGSIGNIEAGTRSQPRNLLKIARALNVTPEWLATGEIDNHLREPGALYSPLEHHVTVGGAVSPDDLVFVPSIHGASLSAGTGEVIWELDEQDSAVAFRLDWMQAKGLRPDRCKVWRVRGESMEPRYSCGDAVLLDMSDRTPRHGKRYALLGDEGLRVKQLLRTPDGWIMHSHNSDKSRFPDEPIIEDNYVIIGRVRARAGDED